MKAIIVEDNPSAANVLTSFIAEYPKQIDIVAVADSIEAAKQLIYKTQPDIWFLDIQLSDKTIFYLLQKLDENLIKKSALIFITAYFTPDYLHKALQQSALDYVVKPIDQKQLFTAIDKAIDKIQTVDLLARITNLEKSIQDIHAHTAKSKIPVHRVNGNIDYLDSNDLIFIETENKISKLYFENENIATVKSLKFYENLLNSNNSFIRVSKQAIINLNWLKSYDNKAKMVILINGNVLNVSRRQSLNLLNSLTG